MTAQTKSTIKNYFETGDKPTQTQFGDFIDSCLFLAEVSSQTISGDIVVSGKVSTPSLQATGSNGVIVYNASGSAVATMGTANTLNTTFAGTVNAGAIGTLTSALTVPNGGTGITTVVSGDIPYGSGVNTISKLAIGAANKILTSDGTIPAWTYSTNQNLQTVDNVTFNSITLGSTTGIVGTTTNDSAAAGSVGQIIESSVSFSPGVSLTTASANNITSISLTAGDWDVWGMVGFIPAGTTTVTALIGSISTTSSAHPTPPNGGGYARLQTTFTTGVAQELPNFMKRISIASTTTIYLVARADFAVSTMVGYGYIGARRVR